MKVIAGLIGGLLVAILASVVYATSLAAIGPSAKLGVISFFVLWACGFYVSLKSSSPTLAWRELLLTAAILSFLLPLSGMLYTGSFMATKLNPATDMFGAQTAGAMIGGGIITALLGFAGFFLGMAFLIPGLLLGRNGKEVFSDNSSDEPLAKTSILKNVQKAAKCPHCDGVVPLLQPECNHCLNRISWINGKAFRPSRPAP